MRPADSLYLQPEAFDAKLDVTTQMRRRGIFQVPVYTAEARLSFDFDPELAAQELKPDEVPLWDETVLRFTVSSNQALRGEARLELDGQDVGLEPSTTVDGGAAPIIAAVGDPRDVAAYSLDLTFNGADTLRLTPAGRTTRVEISSAWPDPSFTGAFLPDTSDISAEGFTATWTIPHLARALPQAARLDPDRIARGKFDFGVRLFQPNDFYQRAYRAARYGILFIALTFVTVLLMESRAGVPTHPVQYIFIGLAQSVFVLLMVAYAEQIGFGPAYALSSAATIVLLTLYGYVALKQGSRALVMGALLIVLYATLYLILRSADYALLAGSTLAFLALAATMWVTRNEDWYGPPRPGRSGLFGKDRKASPAPENAPAQG